jgi:hypothetical protein
MQNDMVSLRILMSESCVFPLVISYQPEAQDTVAGTYIRNQPEDEDAED